MPTASDAQHQDFGAIEAAVKETTRGRAFLAQYARRVQQSDTLTMLAMLGRLERLSQELASRIADLESAAPPRARYVSPSSDAGYPSHEAALVAADHAAAHEMQRIEGLAGVLDDLHRRTVQLASERAGIDRPANAGTFLEIDARAFMPPDVAVPPLLPAGSKVIADDEVLGSIADALAQ